MYIKDSWSVFSKMYFSKVNLHNKFESHETIQPARHKDFSFVTPLNGLEQPIKSSIRDISNVGEK
jgi:hypothetical protein